MTHCDCQRTASDVGLHLPPCLGQSLCCFHCVCQAGCPPAAESSPVHCPSCHRALQPQTCTDIRAFYTGSESSDLGPMLVHYPLGCRSGMETAQPVKCLPCEQKNLVLYTQHPHKKPDMGQQDGSVGKITWCKSLSGPEFDTQNDPNLQEEN